MCTQDKNAKHKTRDDEKSRRKKYVRTRNSKSIKEQGEMGKTMRTIWLRPKWAKNKRHRIGQKEGKRHSPEEHHHSHTYK